MSARLSVRGVHAQYERADDTAAPLAALAGVTTTIAPGEFVCLVGPSGCGKSTLIRIIAGLQAASRGSVLLDDQAITQPSPRVAIMFQEANLMPWRTVIDNLALPLELAGVDKAARIAQARALLPQLGLAEFERAYPGELSGGMAQRTALGRVLIQRPDLLLLDEPFGALDAMTREQVSADLLRLWSAAGMTVLMVTHDVHEAVLLADRVLVMSRRPGQIAADVLIPLARPRSPSMIYDPAFGALAGQIRAAIERT